MANKRKIFGAVCVILATIFIIVGVGLYNWLKENDGADNKPYTGFMVGYLDVGQGDAIFIRFPDSKTMLIDCGINNETNEDTIEKFFTDYSITKIDYFVLTHPDLDHIGNATFILNNYQVQTVYMPYINTELRPSFTEFFSVLDLIEQKQIKTEISSYGISITGEQYKLAFLSPQPKDITNGNYAELNNAIIPSDKLINNVSPIIYLECLGKRFVFTGDAQRDVEKQVVDKYNITFYDTLYKNMSINLENVDYLKLSHHGSDDSSCEEFLSLLKPKNVIISVGANNSYGHPTSETLQLLDEVVKDYKLYRTDRNGNILVKVIDGKLAVCPTFTN